MSSSSSDRVHPCIIFQSVKVIEYQIYLTFSAVETFLKALFSDSRLSRGTGPPFAVLQPPNDRSTPLLLLPDATVICRSLFRPRTRTSTTNSSPSPPPPPPSPSAPNTSASISCVRSESGRKTRQNLTSSGDVSPEEDRGGGVR